jgi:5-methyltetrahydrofolate--homocysteine methyltransferase
MEPILERLKKGEIIVGDGALGTMLFQRGLESGQCPELLNVTKPEVVEEIAQLYIEAGAEIITTNTFGASPVKLANYLLENRTEEINMVAVSIVKNAASIASRSGVYISGSCGPSGKILKPYGDADPGELYAGFLRQMKVLLDERADIICIETMTDIQEAILAVKASKSLSTTRPVIATMTFDETPRGFYTIMGVSIRDACENLQKAGADIIGSNCGNGVEKMIKVAREFKRFSSLPLIIQSNAGLPEIKDGKLFYSETPEFFADKTKELVEAGVSIIGGCCGTTPDHIRAIRKTVDSIR